MLKSALLSAVLLGAAAVGDPAGALVTTAEITSPVADTPRDTALQACREHAAIETQIAAQFDSAHAAGTESQLDLHDWYGQQVAAGPARLAAAAAAGDRSFLPLSQAMNNAHAEGLTIHALCADLERS